MPDINEQYVLPSFVSEKLDQLRSLCLRHGVAELFLFGSAVRGDFRPEDSDLDWIVTFHPSTVRKGLDDPYFLLREDLQSLFGRPVDLVEWEAVSNPYFLSHAQRERKLVYAA